MNTKVLLAKSNALPFRNAFSISSNPWLFDGQVYNLTFHPTVLSPEQIEVLFKKDENLKEAGK